LMIEKVRSVVMAGRAPELGVKDWPRP
jgi:hypothetical protein